MSTVRIQGQIFFAGTTAVYEARVLAGGILEAEYEAQGIVDDCKFDTEGLKPDRR